MADHARTQAKVAGLTRYFTGKPCKHGHVTERMVSSGACLECHKARRRDWEIRNPEKLKAQDARWRAANREKSRAASAKWARENAEKNRAAKAKYRKENPEKVAAKQARWMAANPDRMRALNAEWYAKNRGKAKARDARRRARLLNALADWDIELTNFATEEASELSRSREAITGFAWHIDHMIPLASKKACGLHVWSNLQVIPEWLNLRKNNRMWLTSPGEWIRYD